MNPDAPLTDVSQLLQPFEAAFKPPAAFRVGTEAEKFGVRMDGSPVPFEGPEGIATLLAALADAYGWAPQREHGAGPVIALRRGDASITLEPAGQLELSGAPFETIHETAEELSTHAAELRQISEPLGVRWLSLGFHPFASHDALPHVPKLRYGIMRSYLPTRGPRSLDMMRRTATVQANLDYENAEDAMRKLRVALALQPVVTALFANSPFRESTAHGLLSERAEVWLGMDPDRSGLLPFAWDTSATLEDYVQWALDVPMFLVKRGGTILENTGQTFRAFMRDGFSGAHATLSDWDTHLNSLFPEARLKRTLEVRGADAQPAEALCAVPALWKGLLYDTRALDAAEALASRLDPVSVQAARADIARNALRASLAGRRLDAWAGDMLDIANSGLARIDARDAAGRDERHHLAPAAARLSSGETAAEALLASLQGASDFTTALIAATRIA